MHSYQVELGEIEQAIRRYGEVTMAFVVLSQRGNGIDHLVAYCLKSQVLWASLLEQQDTTGPSPASLVHDFQESVASFSPDNAIVDGTVLDIS